MCEYSVTTSGILLQMFHLSTKSFDAKYNTKHFSNKTVALS